MKKSSIALFVALLLPFACSRNPVTGKRQLSLMSESQEIALGQQSDPSIIAQFGLYENPGMQTFIETKGQEMAKVSHRPDLKFSFKVVDSHVVNAFAVPGGFVYFTRGIMAHFNNEAEFAGVLGHEIGHITARHSASQYTKSMFAQLGLIAGIIIKPELIQYMDVASQGMQMLFLKFGRDDESQSDELGVEYSTKIGYQSHEMADFFKTLNRLSDDAGGRVPTFMSTHPDPLDRYNKVHEHTDKWQEKLNTNANDLQVNRNKYLRMIDGLIYGEDPRQGYVEGNYFYHPELKFVYPIPNGWKTVNSPIQVQMAPADGKALMVLRLSQAKDLNGAVAKAAEELSFSVLSQKNENINGHSAIVTVSDQKADPNAQPGQEQPQVRIRSGFIKFGEFIFEFHGLSATADFPVYERSFDSTIFGFKTLTDQSKINKKPEKVLIRNVDNNTTLGAFLNSKEVPEARHNEHAILNGMELTDPLKKGTLMKVIGY